MTEPLSPEAKLDRILEILTGIEGRITDLEEMLVAEFIEDMPTQGNA